MKKNRTATADKLDDQISRKALRDAIKPLFDKHFEPWTPTERENALFKVATGETHSQPNHTVRIELLGNLHLFEHRNGNWTARFVDSAGKTEEELASVPRERAMLTAAMCLLRPQDRRLIARIFNLNGQGK